MSTATTVFNNVLEPAAKRRRGASRPGDVDLVVKFRSMKLPLRWTCNAALEMFGVDDPLPDVLFDDAIGEAVGSKALNHYRLYNGVISGRNELFTTFADAMRDVADHRLYAIWDSASARYADLFGAESVELESPPFSVTGSWTLEELAAFGWIDLDVDELIRRASHGTGIDEVFIHRAFESIRDHRTWGDVELLA